MYPGYENKKVNIKGSFPIFDSKTYIFRASSQKEEEEGTFEIIDVKKDLHSREL